MSWTDKRIAQLRQLMAEGGTYGSCAMELHTTRNAIAGQCKRHSIHSTRLHGSGRPKARVAMFKPKSRSSRPLPTRAITEEERAQYHTPLMQVGANQCRWPVAEGADGHWSVCCGLPIARERYCERHANIAYRVG